MSKGTKQRRFQSVETFSGYLDVSRNTVFNWIERGWIPVLRVGGVVRIDPEEALEALKSHSAAQVDKPTAVGEIYG